MSFYKLRKCDKPKGELVLNTRTRRIRIDGRLMHQYFSGKGVGNIRIFNVEETPKGEQWYELIHDSAGVKAYMAEIGRKGGKAKTPKKAEAAKAREERKRKVKG
jgi:hypothetical protein